MAFAVPRPSAEHIVDDLGFDAAVNYRTDSHWTTTWPRPVPDGIDVIFENVGGEILEAMLRQINLHARIALCGAIAQYHTAEPPLVPPHSRTLHRRRARMQGFLVNDFAEQDEEAMAALTEWVMSGQIVYRESIVDGLENAAAAFVGLFSGTEYGEAVGACTAAVHLIETALTAIHLASVAYANHGNGHDLLGDGVEHSVVADA